MPIKIIQVNQSKIDEIDKIVRAIYRLVIYSRHHSDDDLLDSYLKGTYSLKELLSIKNAQMEAQNEYEVAEYHKHFKSALDFVIEEIILQNNFENELQLFQLLRLTSPEAHAIHPNRYRHTLVQVGGHICPEPGDVPHLVNELFYQIRQISNPIVKAIYFHHELIRIHPFADGNGRITRLAKNWLFMFDLYPPTFITDYSEKKIYVDSLGNSFRELGKAPKNWNEHTALFFELEIERMFINVSSLYETIKKAGKLRVRESDDSAN